MHGEMLTYGLKRGTENELLHIGSVHNGLGCGCVCPHCKHKLIARNKGTKRIPHFAHARGAEDCGKGRMTALHMLAQQIIESGKKVMLPDYKGDYYQKTTELIEFDEVTLEKSTKLDDKLYRPDCVGIKYDDNNGEHRLWIEILVTHEVDANKTDSIRKKKQPCIEIDLSGMLGTEYTKESVTQRLVEGKEDRVWICCPYYDKKNEENKLKALQEEEENRREAEELMKKLMEEENTKLDEEYRKRIEALSKLKESGSQHQSETLNRQNNIATTSTYRDKHEPQFRPPVIPMEKMDGIIQAVHGKSINPANENYSAELAERFKKLWEMNQK